MIDSVTRALCGELTFDLQLGCGGIMSSDGPSVQEALLSPSFSHTNRSAKRFSNAFVQDHLELANMIISLTRCAIEPGLCQKSGSFFRLYAAISVISNILSSILLSSTIFLINFRSFEEKINIFFQKQGHLRERERE